MTRDEFEMEVKNGSNLVILDNLVLDVTDFIKEHPGGRFALRHNIGRDISKFYFGGYMIDGNFEKGGSKGHIHSSYADLIVN